MKHERESDCWLPDVRLTGLRIRLNTDEHRKTLNETEEKLTSRCHRRRCCQRRCTRPKTHSNTLFNYPRFSVIEQRLSIREGRPVEKDAYSGSTRWPCARFENTVIDSLDRPRGDRIARMRAQRPWRAAKHRIEDAFDRSGTRHVERRTRNVFSSLFNGVLRSQSERESRSPVISRLGPSSPLAQGCRVVHKASHKSFFLTSREKTVSRIDQPKEKFTIQIFSSDERSSRTLFILPRWRWKGRTLK